MITSTLAMQAAFSAEIRKAKEPEVAPINTREYGERIIEMEKRFLSSIPARKNELKTGVYNLEYQFPDKMIVKHEVNLRVSDEGQIVNGPVIFKDSERLSGAANLWSQDSAVYWVMQLPMETHYPSHHFVGVVDGIQIWGHVYRVAMGDHTWHPTSFDIGVFTIKPKAGAPNQGPQTDLNSIPPVE